MCGDRCDEPESYDELIGHRIAPPHEVIVRFEHASDTLGDPALAGREQDVFSWFTLLCAQPIGRSARAAVRLRVRVSDVTARPQR